MKLPRPLRRPATRLLSRVTGRDHATGRPLQTGALPWRRARGGGIELLLVTSRRSRRWLVPKGWPMRGRTLHEAAAREAYEEAGVEGRIADLAIGRFDHLKNHVLLGRLRCTILLFPLEVERELERWPEQGQRARRWFSPTAAAKKVGSAELARLIRGFELAAKAETSIART